MAKVHDPFLAGRKARLSLVLGLTTLAAGISLAALPAQLAPGPVAATEAELYLPPPEPVAKPHDEQVLALAFSPDGKKLVTAGARYTLPGQIKIWDVATGRDLVTIRGLKGVRAVAFSPDGTTFATGDFNGEIKLRDSTTGDVRALVKAHTVGVNGVAFSRDGKMLASAGLDRTVKLWTVEGLQEQQVFHGHTDMVFSVAFFRHGKALVSCGQDQTARIWDLGTGKEKLTLTGHRNGVETVAVSPDDKVVATAGWDGTIRLWDAESGTSQAILQLPRPRSFNAVAFSPDGTKLAGGAADGLVSLWDVKTGKPLGNLQQHSSTVWALAFSPDGKTLASGSSDRTAKLRDLEAGKEAKTLHTGFLAGQPALSLAYAPDGRALGVTTGEKTAQVLDAKTGARLFLLSGHAETVTCLAFSPAGQYLATGSLDATVKVWDRATGKEKHTLKGHGGGVQALVFTADGKKLVSAGDDRTITIWDAELGKELATLKGHQAKIQALALSGDGRSLVSGSADGALKLWDLAQQKEAGILPGHAAPIRALAVAGSGTLASGSEDGIVKLWDLAQGKERHTLKHPAAVSALVLSPSGRTLVSGGLDAAVRTWDTDTGKPRGTLPGHGDGVTALAIHPQGQHLLSAGRDAALLRWQRAASGFPQLPLIFRQDFRNRPIDEQSLKYEPASAARHVQVEAEGLRISLPGEQVNRQPTGFKTRFRVQGDFDVVVSYELLQADRPSKGPGIGVTLYLVCDNPAKDALMLGRVNRKEDNGYNCNKMFKDANGKRHFLNEPVASQSRSGKLRLVRRGSVVTFLVAEEGFEAFRKLCERELSDDLAYVRVAGDAGNADSPPLEVRIVDFEVRGEQAPLAPLAPGDRPAGAFPPALQPPGVFGNPPPQGGFAEAPATRPSKWLATALILGLPTLAGFVALAVWVHRKQSRAAPAAATAPARDQPRRVEAPAAIAFACPDCGQKLKVKAERAGTKVKCARCSEAVFVPRHQA